MNVRRYVFPFLVIFASLTLTACSAFSLPAPTSTPIPTPIIQKIIMPTLGQMIIEDPLDAFEFPTATMGIDYDFGDISATIEAKMQRPAVEACIQALAAQEGVSVESIKLKKAVSKVWEDTCMEVKRTDIECLPFGVPGFRVVLLIGEQKYVYRTNIDGTEIVLVP
jgi:hypothetical protein